MGKKVKLSELKVGDSLIADEGFSCLLNGECVTVEKDLVNLFVRCSDGKHFLDGQVSFEDHDTLIGLTLKVDKEDPLEVRTMAQPKCPPNTIRVWVDAGTVTEVDGIPDGFEYEILDLDTEDLGDSECNAVLPDGRIVPWEEGKELSGAVRIRG